MQADIGRLYTETIFIKSHKMCFLDLRLDWTELYGFLKCLHWSFKMWASIKMISNLSFSKCDSKDSGLFVNVECHTSVKSFATFVFKYERPPSPFILQALNSMWWRLFIRSFQNQHNLNENIHNSLQTWNKINKPVVWRKKTNTFFIVDSRACRRALSVVLKPTFTKCCPHRKRLRST